MEISKIILKGVQMDLIELNTIVVGSGAAGFNAADSLYGLGQKDIAILTEGIKMGTSRNTGSDKQTYYKLNLEGANDDSVVKMAETLFNGGSMNGDTALVEASLSAKCFYKLVDLGVPFPHNKYGEFVGYKTDHDTSKRATSAGPLTSRIMTECLEKQVIDKGIMIFDGFRVISILTDDKSEKSVVGLIAINLDKVNEPSMGLTIFNCTNVVYAVGGPAGMYSTSVYPESQTGASGIAFEAGVKGVNLTESQYGIASTKFRWNLSGTYQQVIPRYISTNEDGSDEKEFLNEYFEDAGKLLQCIFLKGYQWPFDPRKVSDYGSSIIDILVYNETQIKGRKVYMDFMHNPSVSLKEGEFDFTLLSDESFNYLKKSKVLFGKPIERLKRMNQPAIDLYMTNGINLEKEYLQIDVCAQHNNGGLDVNIWWESNLRHFFPVGEIAGTLGIYRPGGSALNSTQVGSYRAAQYITCNYYEKHLNRDIFINYVQKQVERVIENTLIIKKNFCEESNVFSQRIEIQRNMTKNGAHIRSKYQCEEGIKYCKDKMKDFWESVRISSYRELVEVFINWDILMTQYVYLSSILEFILKDGGSRGSYLISNSDGILPNKNLSNLFRFKLDDSKLNDSTCKIRLTDDYSIIKEWEKVKSIPDDDNWFENVWKDYRNHKVIL